ncbi:MAG: threonylcarbamoyl-AMP synthase [Lachnospiraceae bacterium]|nr:threonylcarbamoyl-AMP synthase [Lachnospiraceae bacterium]
METIVVRESELDDYYEEAGRILREGGLVAFPTETVYGLGGNALDPEASAKIYAAKGRPSDNPLIVHVADFADVAPLVREITPVADKLMKKFWPGPLTIIMNKSDIVPTATTGGLQSVAVRMPVHPVAMKLIRCAGVPIAAPSANTSGRPSPTKAEHVIEDLFGRVDMIMDGGSVGIGVESTIVDVTGEVPMILRPGYITKEMLTEAIGDVTIDKAVAKINEGQLITSKEPPKAPGMKYRHYAPKAPLNLICGDEEEVEAELRKLAAQGKSDGLRVGIICSDGADLDGCADRVYHIGRRGDTETIAHNIYDCLRQCDADKLDVIYSDDFGLENDEALGYAVQNRIMKAAGGHVLNLKQKGDL